MEELNEIYITKKQVVQIISDYLEPTMAENGFKWVKSKEEFVKKTDFGFLKISINCKNFWPLKQEINFSLLIVNSNINQIRMRFFNNAKKDDYTISKWLVLPNSNELKFKELYTIEDIEIAKKEAYDLIKKEAFIYLEKYSKLENIIDYSKKIRNSHFMSILLISLKLKNDIQYEEFKNEIIDYIKNPDFDKYEGSEEMEQSMFGLIEYLDKIG